MKKQLILGLIILGASVTCSIGAPGFILMDNYSSILLPLVTYGTPGIPSNGVSGVSGTVGTPLGIGWTAGLYFAQGDVRSSIAADPTGRADPSALGGGLTLGTGPGSTVAFNMFTPSFDTPGSFLASTRFQASPIAGQTITVMVVAYESSASSYATATWRGHSQAFIMTTGSEISAPATVGDFMSSFAVVPEPSAFALAGMGVVAWLTFNARRRCASGIRPGTNRRCRAFPPFPQ